MKTKTTDSVYGIEDVYVGALPNTDELYEAHHYYEKTVIATADMMQKILELSYAEDIDEFNKDLNEAKNAMQAAKTNYENYGNKMRELCDSYQVNNNRWKELGSFVNTLVMPEIYVKHTEMHIADSQ